MKTPVRKPVEELRGLERGDAERTQQQRRHLLGRLREPEALQRRCHLRKSDIEPHTHGGEIE